MNEKYYHVRSKRVMRFLYCLGFDRGETLIDKDGNEYWKFLITPCLLESMEFYKKMRKENFG